MKRFSVAILGGLMISSSLAASAFADHADVAAILFGRNYNDGVTAVSVWPGHREGGMGGPFSPEFQTPARLQAAQAEVERDASLQEALARRHIAPHNVIWVQTAANGGRIIYYR